MMTANLRTLTMRDLREQDLVTTIHDESITSVLYIRSIERTPGSAPWTYNAYGAKEVHRLRNGKTEMTDRLTCRYFVRLAEVDRDEAHPNGLLVAEYSETEMIGEKEQGLIQRTPLSVEGTDSRIGKR
jgi:hypothetical protein